MAKGKTAALLLFATVIILAGSVSICRTVHNYEEMADHRVGYPVPFLSVNLQRYTPLEYPQCFRHGSPIEDPMHIIWPALLFDSVIVFLTLLGIAVMLKKVIRVKEGGSQ
jgi:hypothetical protein